LHGISNPHESEASADFLLTQFAHFLKFIFGALMNKAVAHPDAAANIKAFSL